jgi:hypothetical protein
MTNLSAPSIQRDDMIDEFVAIVIHVDPTSVVMETILFVYERHRQKERVKDIPHQYSQQQVLWHRSRP